MIERSLPSYEFLGLHYFASPLRHVNNLMGFFQRIEREVGERVERVGQSDPPRRKVRSAAELMEQLARSLSNPEEVWLFASSKKLDLSVYITSDQHTNFPSSIVWSLRNCSAAGARVMFDVCNGTLGSFYAICDRPHVIARMRPSDRSIDIRAELPGIFWLTFFGRKYVEFFGADKFAADDVEAHSNGATIKLNDDPDLVKDGTRRTWIEKLGPRSFYDPSDLVGKRPGEFALLLDSLA